RKTSVSSSSSTSSTSKSSPRSSSRPSLPMSRSSRPPLPHSIIAASGSSPTQTDFQSSKRSYMLDRIRRRFPHYTPLNDFEILTLGVTNDVVPGHELRRWLDEQFAVQVSLTGDPEVAIEGARRILDSPGGVTGCKPRQDTPNVYVRAIPNSEYSLRLFPGNVALQEYCADFVRTSTNQVVNCPAGFELWSLPTGSAGSWGSRRIRSLGDTFSFMLRSYQGARGTDTFVLRDGQSYVVRRPEQSNVCFTVPKRTVVGADRRAGDYVLDFPAY
ncbi:hypothetical protein LXA43DRAFT_856854, partial [Ganoderma leucocontextum]